MVYYKPFLVILPLGAVSLSGISKKSSKRKKIWYKWPIEKLEHPQSMYVFLKSINRSMHLEKKTSTFLCGNFGAHFVVAMGGK